MLLGFISLLLTVSQRSIIRICIPSSLASHMLPCKRETSEKNTHAPAHYSLTKSLNLRQRLLSEEASSDHCLTKGKVPLLSLEALHHLHIFIFVLAVVHVIFCATTMVLGGARIRQWKRWEDSVRTDIPKSGRGRHSVHNYHHHEFISKRGSGYWRRAAIIGWVISFFKQFYGSVNKSDYIALRQGFIKKHCPGNPKFDFHKYMMRTLEIDFRKIVGISWYLWLFVVLFLLLNVEGWHTYFWLAFLPLILLLLVGAKLEHIITRLAQEVTITQGTTQDHEAAAAAAGVKLSDELFWFNNPRIVLILIHFILFQNAFEIAFFFWILSTYGLHSCIMEKLGYIIPRLIMGVIVQVLCSYSTLPLYVIVTQMGSMFKDGMFDQMVQQYIGMWAGDVRSRLERTDGEGTSQMHKMISNDKEIQMLDIAHQEIVDTQTTTCNTSCFVHD